MIGGGKFKISGSPGIKKPAIKLPQVGEIVNGESLNHEL